MLSQYYKFLDNELYKYLNDSSLVPGNRYFLILNDINEINKLENAILNSQYHENTRFVSEEFNFRTFKYEVDGLNVIFVFVKEGVTHDFLVTIRNKVSLQKDEWENSVVVFIIKDDLDSITGGAFDLAKQGAPFHTNSLRKNLIRILRSKNTKLEPYEKTIMNFVVENRFIDDLVKYTLMDFEAVYSIIEQGEIKEEDYINLGLFKDEQISTYPEKDAKRRLNENKELFDMISSFHDRGNAKESIENIFEGNQTVSKLSSDDWHETTYESVRKSKEKMEDLKKVNLDILNEEFLTQFNDIQVWDKPGGKTKVKQRERNIIIFNDKDYLNDIEIPFTKNVYIKEDFVIRNRIKLFNLTENEPIDLKITNKGKSKLLLNTAKLNPNDSFYFEFTYKHNNENALTFKFRILIVKFKSDYISNIKTKYKLKYDKTLKKVEISLDDVSNKLEFNDENYSEASIDMNGDKYSLNQFNVFNFTELINQDESNIYFELNINDIDYKIKINDSINKPVPVNGLTLLKNINKNGISMSWNNNKVTQDTNEYYIYNDLKKALNIEQEILTHKIFTGRLIGEEFFGDDIQIDEEIKKNYIELCDLILKKNTLPSLMYFDDELILASQKYCEAVEKVLSTLEDNEKIQNPSTKNIHNIGLITVNDKKYLNPLHPLLLRYEIMKTKEINNEDINEKVLKKYNSANLLPFIVGEEDSYYFSEFNENIYRWIEYKPYVKNSKLDSETSSFIIKTRITDFKKHFNFLFKVNNSFSLKARFVHINNYTSILNGVVGYLLNDFVYNENLYTTNPIDLYIDEVSNKDIFYEFYNLQTFTELTNVLNLKIPNKIKQLFDEEDVMDAIKEKINIFFDQKDTLFHITFMNFDQEPKFSVHNLLNLSSSIAENGLLSNLSFTKIGSEFVSGFGVKGIKEFNPIVEKALLWNSFVSNKQNNQLNPYKKNEGIVNNVTSLANQNIDELFNNTNWVTFIDPSVDLSYFNDDNYDLYVIHYNDQTSSFNYESITVTNNTSQYENVLKEHLMKVHNGYKELNVENIIRSFNILNGEWLLNIIGSKNNKTKGSHIVREKLSIVSAYKNVLAMLDNEKIVWVPISLEEIIRVSRQQGLEASSDIFSAKELGYKGSISDDLLFVGIESNNDDIKIHFMPVEVKVGLNQNVISKASEQIEHLYKLLKKEIIDRNEKKFTQDFYRIFFLNLYFGNLKKFIDNNILDDNKLVNMYEKRSDILNRDVTFTDVINENYSNGLIVLFTEGSNIRKIVKNIDKNIYELHFNEIDAYQDADKAYNTVKNEMLQNKKGIDLGTLLSNSIDDSIDNKNNDFDILEHNKISVVDDTEDFNIIEEKENIENTISDTRKMNIEDNNLEEIKESNIEQEDDNLINTNLDKLKDIRILLGKVEGSNENLYWEYGDYNLPNRHLLISGKSGQGKTYFMQCLLYELSKNNIDSLIVDYTDGFLHTQLEEEFVNKLGDKLKTKFVFRDKLPVNPFKRNDIDLGGVSLPETNDDIADRVVQIVDFVFKLGVQQNSLLKDTVKKGLEIYDESLTFTKIKQTLIMDENPTMQNLYGRISNLLDRDPFDYNNIEYNWSEIFDFKGEVNIIQLKGFTPDIQKVITEFLLWDIYNYSERKGNKNMPIPVLLDEMQNLNHKESSPASKILKEGRKFGWSSWLATQSLTSIKNAGGDISYLFNAAQQIHFAVPEDQISFVSKTLTSDNNEKKRWEQVLSNLNKGQCVVNGYIEKDEGLQKVIEVINVTPLEER